MAWTTQIWQLFKSCQIYTREQLLPYSDIRPTQFHEEPILNPKMQLYTISTTSHLYFLRFYDTKLLKHV